MTDSFKIDAEHPWPWLDAFPEYAEQFFNGRDDEKAALFRCVLSAPVTVLFGKSGLGKSSLLQAGLFPQLRGERLLPIYMRLLHDPNAADLSAQLAKRFSEEIHKSHTAAASPPLHYRYRQNQEDEDAEPIILTDDLWADLHRNDIELVDETGKRWQPVFVLDQFEEIFTLGGQNPNRQTHCFYQLGDLLENRIPKALAERLNEDDELFDQLNPDSQPYRFLLSLREDYLPDLEEWSELIPRLSPNRFRLLPMTAPQAIAAVQKTGGELVTPQDAENIVEYLSANQTAGQQKRRGVTQIEPALLGLMCAGLNEDRLRSQTKQLKTDNLTQQGGLIVERFYDQAFADLPASVRDFVEQHLITSDGVRLAYPVRSMETEKRATAAQLNTLVDKRLLRRESLEEGDRIELVHDRLAQVALVRRRESAQRRETQIQQKKRLRLLVGFAGLLLLVTIFAAYMWQAESKAKQAWMEATATRLAIEGSSITSGLRQGSTLTGLFKVLAGHRLARSANIGEALLDEVLQTEYLKFKQSAYSRELKSPAVSVAYSPDGKLILSGGLDNMLRLWNADTGEPVGQPLTGHSDEIYSVAFSPDGRRFVSGSKDRTLRLWNTDTGRPIGEPLTGHSVDVYSVAFSPDGKRIVSGSKDHTLRLWNADNGQSIGQALTGHSDSVNCVAFSPDGKRIVSGSSDNTLRLWNVDSRQPIGEPLTGHSGSVNSVAFSPDGKRIVSASSDNTLRLWNADNNQPMGHPLTGLSDSINSVAFSPDGQRIVSGGSNNILRLWDAANGRPIGQPLTGHSERVSSVAFSPNGKHIVSGSADNTIRIWPVFEAWADELCKKLDRNMSHKEWREWVSPDIDYIEQCPGLPVPPDQADEQAKDTSQAHIE
ncbi:WD40 repeat domain-containing protein [Methylomonas methanica]|uniref:WD40 repeat-containing protein n=1 Tax=Methylomonas methanica (strain DSM 25384 / MC09) TaxID=857087 RepID=G0A0R3_METMM|nr:WD40 repeat domain-containing protein [Methylomonas methanica]AEF99997.1 WD40 repeat-containing protein [Methylomonas methanica MC09]